jgi:hypothetical protein
MKTITMPAGTKVCFEPETGNETVVREPLTAHDAKWGMNGLPGWVFRVRDGKPTAYTLDWKNTIEHDGANAKLTDAAPAASSETGVTD